MGTEERWYGHRKDHKIFRWVLWTFVFSWMLQFIYSVEMQTLFCHLLTPAFLSSDLPLGYYHCASLGHSLDPLWREWPLFPSLEMPFPLNPCPVLLLLSMLCLILIIASGKAGGLPSFLGATADQGSDDGQTRTLHKAEVVVCRLLSFCTWRFHHSSSQLPHAM